MARTLEGMQTIADNMTDYALAQGILDGSVRAINVNAILDNPVMTIFYKDKTQKVVTWDEVLTWEYDHLVVIAD